MSQDDDIRAFERALFEGDAVQLMKLGPAILRYAKMSVRSDRERTEDAITPTRETTAPRTWCHACGGIGIGDYPHACNTCGGSGRV